MASLRSFFSNRNAVIATEFALVAPILILLWIGMVELATAYLVSQKMETAAQSAADIIAQDKFTDDTKLANIDAAIGTIIAPYDPGAMGYRISSIVADTDGVNTVDWFEKGGVAAVDTHLPTIADDLTEGDDSVIVVTVIYHHTPVLVGTIMGERFFGDSLTFEETVFAKPRLVPVIPRI